MRSVFLVTACVALFPAATFAQNVDLVTLPKRDSVQLTIYNSEDITLAKEVRSVTLKKGDNRLQFSWAGTLIDPTSVEFRPLQHADRIEVSDTVFPGQKPSHLIWNIQSEYEGEALVQVSYFTSGLTWKMDYVAISDPAENEMKFRGHVRVYNSSGEEYDNAEIRLVVGKINLIEKIRELAQRTGAPTPQVNTRRWNSLRNETVNRAFSIAESAMEGADLADAPTDAKKVVKESVGEYFMFSVEGTETIPNGWSKRMPAVRADEVRYDIVYRLRTYQYGPRPVRFFVWKNDNEHGLGESPLPDGVIRVFRDNGRDGLSYLGQNQIRYVPIQADLEVNLGVDDLVVFEQRKTSTRRNNFQFDRHNRVVGWDEHQNWGGSVRNYHPKPIVFELRLQLPGDVELGTPVQASSFDFRTVELKLKTETRDATSVPFSTTIRQGANAKQNRVKLRTPS